MRSPEAGRLGVKVTRNAQTVELASSLLNFADRERETPQLPFNPFLGNRITAVLPEFAISRLTGKTNGRSRMVHTRKRYSRWLHPFCRKR
jgi:hypothetical protein